MKGLFSFTTMPKSALGPTCPPVQCVPGVLMLGLKLLAHQANYCPIFSDEVKNACSYTSSLPYIFMMWCFIKHRIFLHGILLSYAQGELYVYF